MQIQKQLLSEANLKYSKAVDIAVAMETAICDASKLQSELNPGPHVDKLTESNKTTRAKPAATPYCYHCGGNTHGTQLFLQGPDFLPLWETRPYPGRFCRSKQQGKPKQATENPEVHAVEVDVDVDAYEDILASFEVHNVRKQSNDNYLG